MSKRIVQTEESRAIVDRLYNEYPEDVQTTADAMVHILEMFGMQRNATGLEALRLIVRVVEETNALPDFGMKFEENEEEELIDANQVN